MNCGLCGAAVHEEFASATVFNPFFSEGEDEARELRYALCPSCGLVFQTRLLTEEAYGRYYASHAPNVGNDENQKEVFHQRFQVVSEILAGGGSFIVEIGGGNGDFLHMLSAARKVVIDPSVPAKSYAAEHYGELVYHASVDACVAACGEGAADVLVCCHVLEHIPEVMAFFQDCLRLLRDGGRVFVEVPSLNAFAETTKNPAFPNIDIEHVNSFSNQAVANLVQRAGCCLEFLRTDTSTRFPIVQCLARKTTAARQSRGLFQTHMDKEDARFRSYGEALLAEAEAGKTLLFWGCGRKLFQILHSIPDNQRAFLLEHACLYDKDVRKAGQLFCGKRIARTLPAASEINQVVISAESTVTAECIAREARACLGEGMKLVSITGDISTR